MYWYLPTNITASLNLYRYLPYLYSTLKKHCHESTEAKTALNQNKNVDSKQKHSLKTKNWNESCKCGGKLWNQPLKITKWGQIKDSKWSWHKIETFRGARDIFGPKVEGSFKSQDFLQGTILNPWNVPIMWFSRVYFLISRHIYSTGG